jgi:hypothetical protein
MRQYLYETVVLVCTSLAILHGILHLVAGFGAPRVGYYSDADRAQLNWLVQHSTKKINGKYQERLGE